MIHPEIGSNEPLVRFCFEAWCSIFPGASFSFHSLAKPSYSFFFFLFGAGRGFRKLSPSMTTLCA